MGFPVSLLVQGLGACYIGVSAKPCMGKSVELVVFLVAQASAGAWKWVHQGAHGIKGLVGGASNSSHIVCCMCSHRGAKLVA